MATENRKSIVTSIYTIMRRLVASPKVTPRVLIAMREYLRYILDRGSLPEQVIRVVRDKDDEIRVVRDAACSTHLIDAYLRSRGPSNPGSSPVGRKDDKGKPRWSLLPWREVSQVVEVLTYGAIRYGDNNWQLVAGAETRYKDAMGRHFCAMMSGEWIDSGPSGSGMPHAAHIACCALFLLWFRNEDEKCKPKSNE